MTGCTQVHDGRVTPEEFVAALKTQVFDSTIDGIERALSSGPPGRRPSERSQAMHDWYVQLSPQDQDMVVEVARNAAHSALFGMLCVLDGVRVIGNPPHDRLELTDGTGAVLNREGSDLHDMLNALVHPPSESWPPA
jgi:hypothetical protein